MFSLFFAILGCISLSFSAYPFLVSLKRVPKTFHSESHLCGGSIITDPTEYPIYVTTSAKCIERFINIFKHNHNLLVDIGRKYVRNSGKGEIYDTMGVESWVIHPKYNGRTKENNIALLRLERVINESVINTAESIEWGMNLELGNGDALLSVGYLGEIDNTQDSSSYSDETPDFKYLRVLEDEELSYVDENTCNKYYNLLDYLTDNGINIQKYDWSNPDFSVIENSNTYNKDYINDGIICAYNSNNNCLGGDLGGALVYDLSSKSRILLGITSSEYGCGIVPNLYTNIFYHKKWITDITSGNLVNSDNPTITPTLGPVMKPTDSPVKEHSNLKAVNHKNENVPIEAPKCSEGMSNPSGSVCCPEKCGECGGPGCEKRHGGAKHCCSGKIKHKGHSCSKHSPPCVLD